MMRSLRRIAVIALVFSACAIEFSSANAKGLPTHDVVVHGHHLAFHVLPGRLPALVLDAGGGADSSYWNSILPQLAKRTGSEIITYDRAGFGASQEVSPPYRMEDAVADLESGLTQLGLTHDLILIPHSYAGDIATYLAMRHPDWVSGAVLVDTNVPEFFTDDEVALPMRPIIQPHDCRRSGRASNEADANSRSRAMPMSRPATPFTKPRGRIRFHAPSLFRSGRPFHPA